MSTTILVPFDNLLHLQDTFCRAMELADKVAAEVILLRVNLPDSTVSYGGNHEQLYRELKALQAQCSSCTTAVRIETSQGPPEEAIIRFAAENKVDLIWSVELALLLQEGDRRVTADRYFESARPRSPVPGQLIDEVLAHV